MDMKYAVLIMDSKDNFQQRFELALIAHGLEYSRTTHSVEDFIPNIVNYLSEHIQPYNVHNETIDIVHVPLPGGRGVGERDYHIGFNHAGMVVGLWVRESERYGPAEFRTVITGFLVDKYLTVPANQPI